VIDAEDIQRAERVLQVIYGGPMDRQLERMQIDRDVFDRFLQEKLSLLRQRYGNAWHEMDPRLEPAISTILAHFLLVGIIVGRNEQRRIE
jgi:hypothetical protein